MTTENQGFSPPGRGVSFGQTFDWLTGTETNQINPYTGEMIDLATGAYNTNLGNMNNLIASATGINPGQEGFDLFQQMAPYLQNLAMGPTSTFRQGQLDLARRNAREGMGEAANAFAGLGGLYSGASLDAGNRAAQSAFLDATNQVNTLGANLTGSLWGQALPLGFQSAAQRQSAALQGAGLYGNLAGTGLSGLLGYGDPMFTQSQSPLESILGVGQTIAPFLLL